MKTLFLALEDFRSRDAGSRIRDWYIVEALATIGEVTVLCFSPGHTTDSHFDIEGVEFLIDKPTREIGALGRAALRGTMYHVERYDFRHHKDIESVRTRNFDLVVASQMYPMAHLDGVVGTVGPPPAVLWDTHNFDLDTWHVRSDIGSRRHRAFARMMRPRAGRLINESTSLADVIVACTDADGSAWRAVAGDTPVAIVPNAADIAGWQTCRTAPSDKDTFVLFGSLNQESTRAASMRFLDTVWPAYAHTRPGASLIVTGRDPGNNLTSAARSAPRVEVVASPADLIPVVARAGTVVVPQVWGTGSKLKMVEALASGRRIVASPAATVGLPDVLARHVDIAEGADEWHRLMDSAAAAPRTVDQMSQLVELLSDTMSWTTSQRALITAIGTVTGP